MMQERDMRLGKEDVGEKIRVLEAVWRMQPNGHGVSCLLRRHRVGNLKTLRILGCKIASREWSNMEKKQFGDQRWVVKHLGLNGSKVEELE